MVTDVATPPVDVVSDGSELLVPPEPDEQAPSIAPEAEAAPAAEPSPEAIAAWLATADHKKLAELPAWNQQVQRAQAKAQRDAQAEATKQVEETTRVEQWRTWFESLDDRQLREALGRDDYRRAYDFVQSYAQQRSPMATKIAEQVVARLQQTLQERDEFKDLPWDELLALNDPAEFVTQVIDRGLEKERKKMAGDLTKEIDARITEALAKRNLAADEPPTVPAAQFQGNVRGGFDHDRFNPKDPAQVERLVQSLGFDPRRVR